MRKKLIMMITLCLSVQWSVAQAPKWVEKAKRAVFSVVTYDSHDKLLNTGNGFFVTEDGVALSDYSLFKGAQRAVVMSSEGVQMPVTYILGANEMYDIIKFRVGIPSKKVSALTVSTAPSAVESKIYVLPYATQKERAYTSGKIKAIDKFSEKYYYYTIDLHLVDKMVSCPVMTEDGQVIALAQKSSGKDTATICYGVSADFGMAQSISAFSYSDLALKNIGIKKALPDTEEQALVFLFMASSQLEQKQYAGLLDDFIAEYPNSADGYIRRANNRMYQSKDDASLALIEADMDKALSVAKKKDDVYYNRAKLVYSYMLSHPEKPYKDWSYDKALEEIKKAQEVQALPIYVQLEGDINFAKQDYPAAWACYDKVNKSELSSASTFFSAAKTKELMKAPTEEILMLMDSCVSHFKEPYPAEAGPYLLERAQMRMNANQARAAMLDYDAYHKAVNGEVNDVFYYYREQAALKARQFQRALDDLAKAIELNPKEVTYRAELAVVNIRVGRNEEALKVLQEALAIDPNYAEAYRLMGITYLQMKNNKEACTCFAKAKELGDPNVDELIEKHCK